MYRSVSGLLQRINWMWSGDMAVSDIDILARDYGITKATTSINTREKKQEPTCHIRL